MKKLTLITTFLLCICSTVHAEDSGIEGGLRFRSYEVAPDLRTSMRIPADERDYIRYDDFMSLSFDVKIDTEKECFGYICRIITDNNEHVDILLTNPTDGEAHIRLVPKHGDMMKILFPADKPLNEWNRINIVFRSEGKTTDITANGTNHSFTCPQDCFSKIAVCFGANDSGVFSTSDVAPMTIRNIALSTTEKSPQYYFWAMRTEQDLNGGSGRKKMDISVGNPEWTIANNRSWQLATSLSFGDRVKVVTGKGEDKICLVTNDCVTTYSLATGQTQKYSFDQNICFRKLTNDFVILPEGRLFYIDTEGETPVTSEFDFRSSTWSAAIRREVNSRCLHHNVFYNRIDSCIVHMFGYGFHKYSNEISRWNEKTDSFCKWTLDSIPPRYLSAIGSSDSLLYIYGGKGNEKGIQELGTTIYHDLHTISLTDYTVRKVGDLNNENLEVAAADLIISDEDDRFMALFYTPNAYKSSLQMKEIDISDGSSTELGDSIPYNFLDVDSEARLIYDDKTMTFYAVTTEKSDDGSYRVNIYKIKAPIISPAHMAEEDGDIRSEVTVIMILVVLLAASYVAARMMRKSPEDKAVPAPQVKIPARTSPGIYLIGGFKVINRDGADISSNFTPLMKQLLCILVLYSYRKKGISNAELKETLWDDKSEESYYNNRGVNIKKLRTCIAEVGDFEISSAKDKWSIDINGDFCDWYRHMSILEDITTSTMSGERINMLVDIAMSGQLLPDMRYEWADKFKAQYTDLIISTLAVISKAAGVSMSTDLQIRIADATLLFDSLDEDAVKSKCKALVAQKRLGFAQSTFKNFTQEYSRLMGEEFATNFNEFVK